MKIKILLLFLTTMLLTSSLIYSQKGELPENKYKNTKVFKDVFNETRKNLRGISFSYSYAHAQFINSKYGLMMESNQLKQPYGHAISIRQPIYPVFIDISVFKCKFQSKDIITQSNYLSYRGIDFGLSVALFPFAYKVARYIVPYGGAGYQLAEIVETKTSSTLFTKSNIYSSYKMNQFFWKAGIMINPIPILTINFEYRQSIPLKSEKAFNQYLAGIGIKFYH